MRCGAGGCTRSWEPPEVFTGGSEGGSPQGQAGVGQDSAPHAGHSGASAQPHGGLRGESGLLAGSASCLGTPLTPAPCWLGPGGELAPAGDRREGAL